MIKTEKELLKDNILKFCETYLENNMKLEFNVDKRANSVKMNVTLYI
jgi:hypothetical protein